ncbi:MAG TPA: protein translocase subunit SecF, partial [Methanobacteriaceae archaeon]|nr:protein translocase subunit SecF [Methanobacteriaceae archaeon]
MKEKLLQSSYKPIIIIPLIVTILSLVLVAVNGLPGSIDLDGGTTTVLNLEKPVSQSELENIIS